MIQRIELLQCLLISGKVFFDHTFPRCFGLYMIFYGGLRPRNSEIMSDLFICHKDHLHFTSGQKPEVITAIFRPIYYPMRFTDTVILSRKRYFFKILGKEDLA